MTTKEIATIILEQLGGGKFLASTGAKNLAYGEEEKGPFLQFKLPANFAKNRISTSFSLSCPCANPRAQLDCSPSRDRASRPSPLPAGPSSSCIP